MMGMVQMRTVWKDMSGRMASSRTTPSSMIPLLQPVDGIELLCEVTAQPPPRMRIQRFRENSLLDVMDLPRFWIK